MNYSIITFNISDTAKALCNNFESSGIAMDGAYTIRPLKDSFSGVFQLCGKSDVIVVIGGLEEGTKSFVRRAVSEIVGKELKVNENAVEHINRYIRFNPLKQFTKKTIEQLASFPDGFTYIDTGDGYLCGGIGAFGKRIIVLLPEIVTDIDKVFNNAILPSLYKKKNVLPNVMCFKIYGADRSEISAKLAELGKDKRFSVSVRTDCTGDTVITFVFGKNTEEDFINETIRSFHLVFDKRIYADGNASLEERAVDYLTVRRKTVGTAESFTGGMIAERLVGVAGVSSVFNEGLVTYANSSKHERLGVSNETLEQYGAVSDETAYEMALGLLRLGNDYAVATTGIAGPGGGSDAKPVGLCYYAVGSKDGIHVHKKLYSGTRNQIRLQATNDALFALIDIMR